jgi:glycosyltransferase involved in cell wall biosynthesis
MSPELLPLSIVIATRNRAPVLRRTLESIAAQSAQPVELIVVDSSDDSDTRSLCIDEVIDGLHSTVIWRAAERTGAAIQRNEGVHFCSQPVIGFIDDDILFEADCFLLLWHAFQFDSSLGGVNAMIVNQKYHPPGLPSRLIFSILAGRIDSTYAGRVLGPAVNLLPEDDSALPEVVPVEWLNTGCALYRREALPDPPFPVHFTGYSIMEDVSLSLTVGKNWKLANARTARIYHDSQPGAHKSDPGVIGEMQLANRYYVMTRVLGRTRVRDHLKLAIWTVFSDLSLLTNAQGWRSLPARIRGECRAVGAIFRQRRRRRLAVTL